MRLFKLLFGLFLVTYFFYIVISTAPATWAAGMLVKNVPNVALAGVSGSVWRGEAANAKITIDGQTIDLGQLSWQLKPLALLQMKACANIISDLMAGNVCSNAGGKVELKEGMVNRFPANLLNNAMGVQLGGTADIAVKNFEATDDGFIYALEGDLIWEGASINVGTGWFSLGDYGIELSENGSGGLYADISDVKGEFEVDVRGDIKLREMPKMSGTIKPSEAAPFEIKQALSLFGEPLDNGGYKVQFP